MKKFIKRLQPIEYIIYTAIIATVIAMDQITKALAVKFLMPIDTQPIIEGVLHLTYAENEGAAFGILANHRWVFMSVSIAAIAIFLFLLYAGVLRGNLLYTSSIALMIAGGIGNMIDRIALGYVVDFIDFRLIDFAIFNGADSFVCIGAALLLFSVVMDVVKEAKSSKDTKDGGTQDTND